VGVWVCKDISYGGKEGVEIHFTPLIRNLRGRDGFFLSYMRVFLYPSLLNKEDVWPEKQQSCSL
jgi:hypothetical protein